MPRKPKTPSLHLPELPPIASPSAGKIAQEKKILADLEGLVQRLEQRSLNTAIALAQQAARGEGPLVAHFMEIGRRYAKLLDAPSKPKLRLVQGGLEQQRPAIDLEALEEARIKAAVAKHGSIIAAMRAGAI